jgi:hypothetical protein
MMQDRKAMIREYKETPRTMGVGAVRHIASGKLLVIAGQDLPSLLNRHQAQLRLGAHGNRALQQDWVVHGPEGFTFEVLDTLARPADKPDYDPTDDLRALEALWLEKLAPFEPAGYNRPAKLGS